MPLVVGVDPAGLPVGCGCDIVWTEVEGPDSVEGYFAVETEALEANGGNLVTVLVEGENLSGRGILGLKRQRRVSLTVCADLAAILRGKESNLGRSNLVRRF